MASAADLVAFMDQHYSNLTAEQEERVREIQACEMASERRKHALRVVLLKCFLEKDVHNFLLCLNEGGMIISF